MAEKKSYTFKYVGDPNDEFGGPQVVNQYGYNWVKGEEVTVEIDEDDKQQAEQLKRLQGNSHFVDTSDEKTLKAIDERQEALEKREADKAQAAEEQRQRDEEDEKQRQENLAQAGPGLSPSASAIRAPGTVTRKPVTDAFGGRPVEERTRSEDHTVAGKTKS